jgi:hypothetical protein
MSASAFQSSPLPGAGPHEPLALLYECHRQVLQHCATLRRLVLYLSECGCNREAQVASHGLLRFFDNEVPWHLAGEEEDLFPALIESMAGSDAVCLHDLTRGSAQQHRALERLWCVLRFPLEELAAGREAALSARAVEEFDRQWHEHSAQEEGELLPMAVRLLTDDEMARVERGMEARRV